jgi:hypothetical protein
MKRLGYHQYIANGGDWGSIIAPELASYEESLVAASVPVTDPKKRLLGVHLNGVVGVPPAAHFTIWGIIKTGLSLVFPSLFFDSYDQRKLKYMQNIPTEMSYFLQQMTKPQTIGMCLQNSPVSVAAWLVEKFVVWTDCSRRSASTTDGKQLTVTKATSLDDKLDLSLRTLELSIPMDDMLTIVSLYWFTNTITSSVMMYHNTVNFETAMKQLSDIRVHTPVAVADFPVDVIWSPLMWARETYTNIIQYNRFSSGNKTIGLLVGLFRLGNPRISICRRTFCIVGGTSSVLEGLATVQEETFESP